MGLRLDIGCALPPVIAVGAHLKNTVAVSVGDEVAMSQCLGELDTPERYEAFKCVIAALQARYDLCPAAMACDLHPDYLSTQYAESCGLPVIRVQHHYAHVLSCMADNGLDAPVLGVSWDGTGYGTDGAIWGGEFLRVDDTAFTRAAHLRAFPLPGGEKAIKEPRRSALGLLYALYGAGVFSMQELAPLRAFSPAEQAVLKTMLVRQVNTPLTSSAGRLFDAVAALIGLRQQTDFEGQAAMALESALEGVETDERYDFEILTSENDTVVDWALMVENVLDDLRREVPGPVISARFHNTLADMIVAVARYVGEEQVVLTGGCFQNKYLLARAIQRLESEDFRPHWHHRVPTNDAGLAVGQIMAAARELRG